MKTKEEVYQHLKSKGFKSELEVEHYLLDPSNLSMKDYSLIPGIMCKEKAKNVWASIYGCWSSGHNGSCCCNCVHYKKVMKHPWNKGDAKGTMSEQMGWACVGTFEDGSNLDKVVFSDRGHGLCELHRKKK